MLITTPYELWTGRRPDLSYMHPWGQSSMFTTIPMLIGKLSPKANKCIFITYSDESKRYVMFGEQPDEMIIETE